MSTAKPDEKTTPASAGSTGSATVLSAKVEAIEKLVIELTLIAICTATIKHHHKARLDHLLGELQYAGMIELEKDESPNDGTQP